MKIIIIGCGKVGAYVAKQLLDSHHQVTIIERDQNVLSKSFKYFPKLRSYMEMGPVLFYLKNVLLKQRMPLLI